MRCKLLRLVQRRPRLTAVLLAFLLLASATAGLYIYALGQWQAAQAAVNEGRPAEARSRLQVCLLVWPRSVAVHLLAGRAARVSGDFQEAENHLNRCLKLQKDATGDTELEFLLMRVQRGEEEEVAPLLWECVNNDHPQSCMILKTLALAYMYHLRYGPSLVCLNGWIEKAPNTAEAYDWRGWVLERLNDRTGALRDYQRAVDLDPNLSTARLRLVELDLMHLLDADAALPHLEWLRRQFPNRPDIQARLGWCRLLQGQREEARRLMEAAVEKLPQDTLVRIQLAKLELQDGRPVQAEHWLRQVLQIDPTDTQAEYLLISALQQQNRQQEVEAVEEEYQKTSAQMKRISQVLEKESRQPASSDAAELYEVGMFFLRGKQDHLGLYWLHQALERNSRHKPTHKALAEYYEKKGDKKQAEAHRRWLHPADKKPASGGR